MTLEAEMLRAAGGTTPSTKVAQADEGGFTLAQIATVLRRRLLLILLVGLGGAGLAVAASTQMTKLYAASAVVAVDVTEPDFSSAVDEQVHAPVAVGNKIELIASRELLGQVMEQMRLFDDPFFNPPPSPGLVTRLLRQLATVLPKEWLVRAGLAADQAPATVPATVPASLLRDAAIDRLKRRLVVTQPSGAEVLQIGVEANEPAKAADIANNLALAYVSWESAHRRQLARDTASLLHERLAEFQAEVQKAEQEAAEFRNEHGLALAGSGTGTLNDQRLGDLRSQLVALRGEQIAKQAQLERAQAARSRGGDALADLGTSAPAIIDLRSQESDLERRRAELSQTYASRHPQMLGINSEIQKIRQRLAREVDRAIASLEDELVSLTARQQVIEHDIAALQGGSARDREAEVQLQEFERQAAAARNLYESMLSRYRKAEEAAGIGRTTARIVSAAGEPLAPVTPGPLVLGLVGFTASVALGSMLAFLLEGMDRRVQTGRQLETVLGVPSLGVLPFIRQRPWRELPADYIARQPFTYFAEAAQSVLMQIELAAGQPAPATLAVTSALPGEGKTTLAVSLAAAITRGGQTVCVVDLDLRRPRVAAKLGRPQAMPGLADFVAGRAGLDEVVHRAEPAGFDFVPVGRPPDNALMLLKSPAFSTLWGYLRSRYDILVVDSSPLLALAETHAVCRLAEHFVIAVRWRHTDTAAAEEVVRHLSTLNPRFVGMVVTMVEIDRYKLYAHGEAGAYYRRYRKYYAG